jgi:multiple sugar transport system permease protein
MTTAPTRPTPAPTRGRYRRREGWLAYAFLGPALILFVVFLAGPLIGALVLSLFRWDLLTTAEFAGVDNLARLFTDPRVGISLRNTIYFTVFSMIIQIIFALILALGVNRAMRPVLQYILRTAYFFPFLISWAAVALIWKYGLDPNFGFIRYYVEQLGFTLPNFLISEQWAMPAVVFVDVWKTMGFTFIILLAGLQGIPQQVYEAARLDGADTWRQLIHVTIPLLSPTLFFVIVMTMIGSLQVFEPMLIMTDGGPGDSTVSIVMYIYETGFRSFEIGYASAIALLVFVLIMAITLIQLWLSRRWVHYDQ